MHQYSHMRKRMPDKNQSHTKCDCTYNIEFFPKYRWKVLYAEERKKLMLIFKHL